MQTEPANLYEFGDFQLDPVKRLLRRLDGTPVPLAPRVFDTLLYMVEHHDSVMDKERIMEAVWPDSIVEENNLAQAIWKLRQVFGETPGSHSYIVTVPGRGYRFVAEVNKRNGDMVSSVPTDSTTTPTSVQGPTEADPSELPSPRLLSLVWQYYFSLAIAVCPPVCGHPVRLPRPTLSYQSLRASLRRALRCCHLKILAKKNKTPISPWAFRMKLCRTWRESPISRLSVAPRRVFIKAAMCATHVRSGSN